LLPPDLEFVYPPRRLISRRIFSTRIKDEGEGENETSGIFNPGWLHGMAQGANKAGGRARDG